MASCGVRSGAPRGTNSSATTSIFGALAFSHSWEMREKSCPESVFSFSIATLVGFSSVPTAAITEVAMSLAVGLSWKTYSILLSAIFLPMPSDAEQQVTIGVLAFWNSSITRMKTSLDRKPTPAVILSTVSARVTTLRPVSPLPSSSYQMTLIGVFTPLIAKVGCAASTATSMPAFICAPTSALMPESVTKAPSFTSCWAKAGAPDSASKVAPAIRRRRRKFMLMVVPPSAAGSCNLRATAR